ncbi:efflux RND transporter periplasmic adaptor subunit [Sulfitobacter sp. S190]|uniref:efflux RND transporter periplasmic adaptor subunit n=1 Tax=Sulfitobacter sp. S190 TaxID=2867022 RepID=UPI0021A7F783|nr:efflux RND transporter periplasmic adaptor subunit [Sulfitobacter sp. S190]UWR21334.1 efflux RND transporter periplasmic adaptor subunit [Sulfitobacter sp. S190]
MRVFPILAAALFAGGLYLAIFERAALVGFFAADEPPQDAQAVATIETGDAGADAQAPVGRVKVVVQRSRAQQIDSAVVLRGQTAAARQVDVRAETSAIVISEPLRKGAQVSRGQELCVLDKGTRGAALEEARARLAEAESRVPESEARVMEARALLEEARINQNASSKLSEGGFASTTRVAGADAAVAAAQAGVSSAQSGLRAARSGIEAARAAVASAESEIDRLTIAAPFDGLLESDTAELGSLLQPGALCATILQLDPIKLVGFVPETEVNRVRVGAMAAARLAAGGDTVQGEVTFLSRSADPATRTFLTEIEVPNDDLNIRDGQTAEILIASEGANAHLIPSSSLTLNDDGTLGVRTVNDEAVVRFVPVTLVRDAPDGVWVTGLPQIADVIVVGQEYVIDGVTVDATSREVTQ